MRHCLPLAQVQAGQAGRGGEAGEEDGGNRLHRVHWSDHAGLDNEAKRHAEEVFFPLHLI